MYVRCAFFEGDVKPSDRDHFERCIVNEVAPQMAEFPGCREVRLLLGRKFQDGVQDFYLVLEHIYDDLEDIHTAVGSENRDKVWHHLNKVLPLFDGRITHLNAENHSIKGQRR